MQPFPFSTIPSKLLLILLLLLPSTILACTLLAKMTIKGGTSQACAACKYQRRRCSRDCILAPFFPADQPKMFQNAHRLFGVRNIMNILKQLNEAQLKEEAMRSIIYESYIRERSPVHGCWGIICQLSHQLRQTIEELHYVKTRLALCRDQYHNQIASSPSHYSPSSQLQLGIFPTDNALPTFQHHSGIAGMPLAPSQFIANGNDGFYVESNDNTVKPLWAQHHYNNLNNNNSMAIQSQMVPSQAFPIQQETEVFQDYDDIPFDTIADDRQSYIESDREEACESSSESTLKDTTQPIEHVSKNELKSAAACLSLTSVN